MPCVQANQHNPPSSSPQASESSFVTCHVSKFTNLLLPLQEVMKMNSIVRLCSCVGGEAAATTQRNTFGIPGRLDHPDLRAQRTSRNWTDNGFSISFEHNLSLPLTLL